MKVSPVILIIRIFVILMLLVGFSACSPARKTQREVRKKCNCPKWTQLYEIHEVRNV